MNNFQQMVQILRGSVHQVTNLVKHYLNKQWIPDADISEKFLKNIETKNESKKY